MRARPRSVSMPPVARRRWGLAMALAVLGTPAEEPAAAQAPEPVAAETDTADTRTSDPPTPSTPRMVLPARADTPRTPAPAPSATPPLAALPMPVGPSTWRPVPMPTVPFPAGAAALGDEPEAPQEDLDALREDLDALGDDPEALELYRQAREHLNRGELEEAAALFREIHEDHPDVSFAARAQYYEALARLRHDSDEERGRAVRILRTHADEHRNAATARDAQRLVQALQERGGTVEAAFEAVSLDETVPAACPEEVVQVRQAAFHSLQRRDSDQARELARELAREIVLSEDPCDADLRAHALWVIGRAAAPEDVEILVGLVREADQEQVRRQAAAALGQGAADEEIYRVLVDLAQDPDVDPSLRQTAVHQALRALGDEPEEEAGERLVDLYHAVRDDGELIRPVVFSLSRMDHPEAIAIVMEVARDGEDPELQRHAIHALSNVDDPAVDELLRELLGRDP